MNGIRALAAALPAALVMTATASAQTPPPPPPPPPAAPAPQTPGKAGQLHFDFDATLPPVAGRIPKGLTFTAPTGYKVDFRAAPKRCTPLDAKLDECPAKSRIGSGTLVIQVTQPGQVRDVNVPLKFYLKSKKDVYAVAFLAGTRVIPGTIDTSNGMVLAFNPLPDPPAFPQVTYALVHVTVDVGAKRKAVVKKVRRRHGHKVVKRTKKTYSFLRNPAQCPGSWPTTVTLTYPDTTFDVLSAPTACAA